MATASSKIKEQGPPGASPPRFWRRPFDADTIPIPRGDIHVIQERCKGCAFCVEYCPTSVLELSADFNSKGYHPPFARDPGSCVQCGLCETVCPDFAIFVTAHPNSPSDTGGG